MVLRFFSGANFVGLFMLALLTKGFRSSWFVSGFISYTNLYFLFSKWLKCTVLGSGWRWWSRHRTLHDTTFCLWNSFCCQRPWLSYEHSEWKLTLLQGYLHHHHISYTHKHTMLVTYFHLFNGIISESFPKLGYCFIVIRILNEIF